MRLYKIWIAALLLCAGMSSCRTLIREDRGACPGLLFFDVTNAGDFDLDAPVFAAVYRLPEDDYAADGTALMQELQPDEYCFRIPKADYWSGYGMVGMAQCSRQLEACWSVPEGQQWDPLYRFRYQVEGWEESVTVPVTFQKEFSKLSLVFVHLERFEESAGRFPFDLVLKGSTSGLDALEGKPLRGAFSCRPEEGEKEGSFQCRIPRQGDADLRLELWGKKGVYPNEELVDTLPLGDLIVQNAHVDWQEESLPDIYLEIDYVQSSFQITVTDWEQQTHEIF